MIFHPAIIALLLGSILLGLMLVYSGYFGVRILRDWDIASGSELQLGLERRTYLISTLMAYAFGFQLISLFLFIYTVEELNPLFVGAMCAAGTLNVNAWGYPAMVLKTLNFVLAGLWLILNFADNRAYDYPLIRKKYLLLLLIGPFILGEVIVQFQFFLHMRPNVITSCCGTLFSSEAQGITSGLVAIPHRPMAVAYYVVLALAFATGARYRLTDKGGCLFSLASVVAFFVSVLALISLFGLYVYELPTHHCPFCILKREYGYIGYPLYLALLWGVVLGLGVGVLIPHRRIPSLTAVLPPLQRRLTSWALLAYGLSLLILTYEMLFSNLSLKG